MVQHLNGMFAFALWDAQERSLLLARQGVALDGLIVAGAVRANATLGDPYANPYPAKSVLLVDERATPRQRQARGTPSLRQPRPERRPRSRPPTRCRV